MLAALADGSLPEAERVRLTEQTEATPELGEELAAQRRALAAMEPLRAISAPTELHAAVNSLVSAAPAPKHRRSGALRLAPAGALVAAVALIAAFLAGSTGSSTPTVSHAALAALRPATLPSPAESHRQRGTLVRSVDGIPFPYWEQGLGWRTNGARTDQIAGHTATTVFYTPKSSAAGSPRVGYTILAGKALPVPNAPAITRRGIHFRVLSADGATVVTWRRAGHTCILAARGVPASTLARLASWA
jgi:hypothetical protein